MQRPKARLSLLSVLIFSVFIAFLLIAPVARLLGQQRTASTVPPDGLRTNTPSVVALINATITTHPGVKVKNAVLVLRAGRIEAVGATGIITPPPDARIVDCKGLSIYPGLIDSFVTLPEESIKNDPASVELLGNKHWNSRVTPQLRADRVFKRDEQVDQKWLSQGVVARHVAPAAGVFRGTSVLVSTGTGDLLPRAINPQVAQGIGLWSSRGSDGYPTSAMGAYALVRQTLLDSAWYAKVREARRLNPALPPIEVNDSLAALSEQMQSGLPLLIDCPDENYVFRALALKQEFGGNFILRGSGFDYRVAREIAQSHVGVIVPLNFPKPPAVASKYLANAITLEQLSHWDLAPESPARLVKAGVKIAISSAGLKNPGEFLPAIRMAVQRGLSKDDALRALTIAPAELLGSADQLGSIEPGKRASFIVTRGDLFDEKTEIVEVWADGHRTTTSFPIGSDPRGQWTITLGGVPYELSIAGKQASLSMKLAVAGERTTPTTTSTTSPSTSPATSITSTAVPLISDVSVVGSRLTFTIKSNERVRLGSAVIERDLISGSIDGDDGFSGSRIVEKSPTTSPTTAPTTSPTTAPTTKPSTAALFEPTWPMGAHGRTGLPERPKVVLFKDATVWTCGPDGVLRGASVLVVNGKIQAIGQSLFLPPGTEAVIIDCQGKHLSPGIIDAHSHIATDGGINESGQAVTCETRIGDFLDPTDITIYRQLAGGVTAANVLHGSANPIGGQSALIKLRWGAKPDELRFANAVPTVKFALGENVKQSNWGERFSTRYPQTRMGVEQIMTDAFAAAKDYAAAKELEASGAAVLPVRRDLELDALSEIVTGRRLIHCHSYRQDEILAMMRTAEKFGIRVAVFQHILEGYKVATEMAAHGAAGSAFADWWAFKFEVYDAIPQDGPIMREAGVLVSYNSDDAELGRRLNQEAAKAVKYGGVPEEDALNFVTLNPAKQLRIDSRVGSIEVGKDADLVVWSGPPLSIYSKVEQTWIDGRNYFSIAKDTEDRKEISDRRKALIQRILGGAEKPEEGPGPVRPRDQAVREDIYCAKCNKGARQ